MKSYSSFEDISQQLPKLSDFIKNHEIYLAHTPKSIDQDAEKLLDHINKVNQYALKLIEINNLDPVVDRLISDMILLQPEFENIKVIGNYIKTMFFQTIIFHDYGKINPNFQIIKMGNKVFKEDQNIKIDSQHSKLSAYIFIHYFLKDILEKFENEAEQSFLWGLVFLFSNTILKHHASYIEHEVCFDLDVYSSLHKFLIPFNAVFSNSFEYFLGLEKNDDGEGILDFFEKYYSSNNFFSIFSLLKLNYSLLTASDYLATNEYMNGVKITEYGVLTRERINEIYGNAQEKQVYNQQTYKDILNYQFQKPTLPSNDNLNILRKEMAIEVIQNIRSNINKKLFYIEAPTGGGKTNLSMLATAELLKADSSLNKVFYVFPFTTLITQTYASIIKTLGLREDEVVQLHSKAGFQAKNKEDDQYGADRKNYIDNLFVNYPFCLLTHIKFFDILKSNEKEANYLLHRLANSVVVIDELQSYNPSHWDKIIYFIRNYAEFYNIKFILMSATLPKLDKINILKGKVDDFVYLLENPKNDYFQNPNYANRVKFNFDLLNKKVIQLDELSNILLEKSKIYAEYDLGKSKPQGSIYTIIEFIFKITASEFYKIVRRHQNDFFDEIFVLSGTILEHRRRYIINFLKNPKNRQKKILLITTQVVEAGVDIDMDLGFKNKSLIDSDEQLAGRINRNVNKDNCVLYIFEFNEPSKLYSKDQRYTKTKESLNQADYQNILLTKNFDLLYNLVLENINEWNCKAMAIGFNEYLDEIKYLNFHSVSEKFKLIENESLLVFVPIDIPIKIDGISSNNSDMIFSKNELDYLSKAMIIPNKQNKIEGEKVFELYLDLIHNKKIDFMQNKINSKILQSIMSKFAFSTFSSFNNKTNLLKYATDQYKNEYGYVYLNAYNNIYNEEMGLDLDNDDTIIF